MFFKRNLIRIFKNVNENIMKTLEKNEKLWKIKGCTYKITNFSAANCLSSTLGIILETIILA